MKNNQMKFTDTDHLTTHLNKIQGTFTIPESFETIFIFKEEFFLDTSTDVSWNYVNEDRDLTVVISVLDGVYTAELFSLS